MVSGEQAGRPKILIVDDSPENLHVLVHLLRDDYRVMVARDGPKALELVALAPPPDLILLDIMMPGMDGYEVLRRLQENEATRGIAVIILTALSEDEDETRGLNLGAIDYIRKPIRIPVVRLRVKNHLELVRARRQLEEQNRLLLEAAQLREDVDRITRHDLKSPLTPIIGLPQVLLADDNLTDDQREALQQIEHSGYRMLEIINRSLDLYKMETGMYQIQPYLLDLAPVLSKIFKENSSLLLVRQVQILCMMEGVPLGKIHGDSPCLVWAEELLCYSMLANLVKNAVEAVPNGGQVTVTAGRKGAWVVVRIHNPGVVPEAICSRFFEKYATSGKKGGTGLGTYSAWLIAKTIQGEIFMESSSTEGTTITVHLPGEQAANRAIEEIHTQ